MKASGLSYLFKEGVRNLWANRLMSAASIGVLTACLLLIGASTMFSLNIRNMMDYVESQNEIVVFVEEDATQEMLTSLEEDLKAIENVNEVTLVTKAEALEKRKKDFGDAAFLLEDYNDENNPLLDSFVVTLDDIALLDDSVREMQLKDHVYTVSATKEVASAMVSLSNVVTVAGFIIVAILIIVSAVIISNTIRLTIYNRRKEIHIMKCVGATDFFIKLPFIIEGVLLGLISATISYIVLWIVYGWMYTNLAGTYNSWFSAMVSSVLPFSDFGGILALGFLAAGLCVGIFGSGIFVRKHLRA